MYRPLLDVKGLTVSFGGVKALTQFDLDVREGDIVAVIGPNGAGKTTAFNCITGVYPPQGGQIRLEDISLLGLKQFRITQIGIARTFQNIRLFPNMTAIENVQVGADAHHRTSVPGALLRGPRHRIEERDGLDLAGRMLARVGISHRAEVLARNLPYGDQRRLEIARALATQPRILLLDEPAAGMNSAEKAALMNLIRQIRDDGLTILVIDHDMRVIMGISDKVVVLNFGVKIAEGTPSQVQGDPRVVEAYLGSPGA